MTTALVAALQAALATEQQIAYGYAVAGAHLPETQTAAVTAVWNSHRARRDELEALTRAAGAAPVAPRTAYAMPFPVDSTASALRLIAHLESGGAGAAWDLVLASPAGSAVRRLAVTWLTDAAVDQQSLTGSAPALPGRPRAAVGAPGQ